ncbi:MAG TPA: tannase/feruloyl esterase family alpha/beta hydrolase [Candidatus Acidoferrales bacterium]|nr:tannase/feruloyl esterase family alpha/beta hydrolase [Candidatus Acidoferrales bacterium]
MENFQRTALLSGLLGLCLAVSSPARGQQSNPAANGVAPAEKCAELVNLTIPDSTMTITKAEEVPTAPAGTIRASGLSPDTIPVAIPSYCRADGVIDPRTGADGKPYAIGFAIALPDNWNGRFLFQGGGGLNGSVNPPYGAQAAGDSPALARGFAVVSSDTGHKGAVFDPAFMKDQVASLNFAYIAVGRVTVLAKRIIAQYYGQPAKRSYYDGCSTGGREGMLMSQRYPAYFDGIISGDPAMRTGYSNIGLTWARLAFAQIAPKDASGKPVPSQDFSESDKKLLADAIMNSCDQKDGLKDGMIFNPEACHFDPAVLTCKGAKADTCLTSQQVGALEKAFSGPKDSLGNQVYSPFPYDTGYILGTGGVFTNFLPSAGPSPIASVQPPADLSIDQLVANVHANESQTLSDTTWTNLTTFFGHGGKLVFYHGTSDPVFSPLDTLAYYKKMVAANGGLDQAMSSSRFYFVPGMNHCQGGPATLDNFDLLGAVVNWVENGVAPDFVVAKGKSLPGRTRPLCAYPKYAHYKGQGDPQDAGNFECVQ